jgi:hypothetical protein
MRIFDPYMLKMVLPSVKYLNPGTGGLIIQLLLGSIFAIGLAVRVFWSKIKKLFASKGSETVEAVTVDKDDCK